MPRSKEEPQVLQQIQQASHIPEKHKEDLKKLTLARLKALHSVLNKPWQQNSDETIHTFAFAHQQLVWLYREIVLSRPNLDECKQLFEELYNIAPAAMLDVFKHIKKDYQFSFSDVPKELEQAARKGHALALIMLGERYERGNAYFQQNLNTARIHYQLAAAQGDPKGQYHTARCFEQGIGDERNPLKARHYYQLAADQGHAKAQTAIAICFEEGIGGAKDIEKAREYRRLAGTQSTPLISSNWWQGKFAEVAQSFASSSTQTDDASTTPQPPKEPISQHAAIQQILHRNKRKFTDTMTALNQKILAADAKGTLNNREFGDAPEDEIGVIKACVDEIVLAYMDTIRWFVYEQDWNKVAHYAFELSLHNPAMVTTICKELQSIIPQPTISTVVLPPESHPDAARANFLLAIQYEYGIGVKANREQAIHYLTVAARSKYSHAYFVLHQLKAPLDAELADQEQKVHEDLLQQPQTNPRDKLVAHYCLGRLAKENNKPATVVEEHYKQSADAGFYLAQSSLAYLYLESTKPQAFQKASIYYRLAAAQGDRWARFQSALRILEGDSAGRHWPYFALQGWHTEPMSHAPTSTLMAVKRQLAEFHDEAVLDTLTKDYQRAFEYLQSLLDPTLDYYPVVNYYLGLLCEAGFAPIDESSDEEAAYYTKARHYYQAAAQAGHASAALRLSLLFAGALGGEFDYKTAWKWYERAIKTFEQAREKGETLWASYRLGIIDEDESYKGAWDSWRRLKQAVNYYKEAWRTNLYAAYRYGSLRNNAKYLEKAARAGHPLANFELGMYYEQQAQSYSDAPKADPSAYEKARKCYEAALQSGFVHPRLCFSLGRFYHAGLGGIAKDAAKAQYYYELATGTRKRQSLHELAEHRVIGVDSSAASSSMQTSTPADTQGREFLEPSDNDLILLERAAALTAILDSVKPSKSDYAHFQKAHEKALEKGLTLPAAFYTSVAESDDDSTLAAQCKAGNPAALYKYAKTLHQQKSGQMKRTVYPLLKKYYKLAAHLGHLDADYALGVLERYTPVKAQRHFKNAADRGHKEAQYELGSLLAVIWYNPDVNDIDAYKGAYQYWEMAAKQGHIMANYSLAALITSVSSISDDALQEAHLYYCKFLAAADKLNQKPPYMMNFQCDAQFRLYEMYENGQGCAVDHERAYHYYKLAYDNRHHKTNLMQLGVLKLRASLASSPQKDKVEKLLVAASSTAASSSSSSAHFPAHAQLQAAKKRRQKAFDQIFSRTSQNDSMFTRLLTSKLSEADWQEFADANEACIGLYQDALREYYKKMLPEIASNTPPKENSIRFRKILTDFYTFEPANAILFCAHELEWQAVTELEHIKTKLETENQETIHSIYQKGKRFLKANQIEAGCKALYHAAAQGHAPALFALSAAETETGNNNVNFEKLYVYYRLAATQDVAQAISRLGELYEHGLGVAKNIRLARQYYDKAAMHKEAQACYRLAFLYAKNPNPDYINAVKYYVEAAKQGHAGALFNLGVLYERGAHPACHGQPNFSAARQCFLAVTKPADNENRQAVNKLLSATPEDPSTSASLSSASAASSVISAEQQSEYLTLKQTAAACALKASGFVAGIAMRTFKKAKRLEEQGPEHNENQFAAVEKTRFNNRVIALYERFLRLTRSAPEQYAEQRQRAHYRITEIHLQLALALRSVENEKKAIRHYQEAATLETDSPLATEVRIAAFKRRVQLDKVIHDDKAGAATIEAAAKAHQEFVELCTSKITAHTKTQEWDNVAHYLAALLNVDDEQAQIIYEKIKTQLPQPFPNIALQDNPPKIFNLLSIRFAQRADTSTPISNIAERFGEAKGIALGQAGMASACYYLARYYENGNNDYYQQQYTANAAQQRHRQALVNYAEQLKKSQPKKAEDIRALCEAMDKVMPRIAAPSASSSHAAVTEQLYPKLHPPQWVASSAGLAAQQPPQLAHSTPVTPPASDADNTPIQVLREFCNEQRSSAPQSPAATSESNQTATTTNVAPSSLSTVPEGCLYPAGQPNPYGMWAFVPGREEVECKPGGSAIGGDFEFGDFEDVDAKLEDSSDTEGLLLFPDAPTQPLPKVLARPNASQNTRQAANTSSEESGHADERQLVSAS